MPVKCFESNEVEQCLQKRALLSLAPPQCSQKSTCVVIKKPTLSQNSITKLNLQNVPETKPISNAQCLSTPLCINTRISQPATHNLVLIMKTMSKRIM